MVLGYWQKAVAPENLLKSLLIVCSLQKVTSGMCLLFPQEIYFTLSKSFKEVVP